MDDTPTTGARPDAVELLTTQHRDMEQLWTRLQAAHTGPDRKLEQQLGRELISLLSQHDAIETMILYPALRKAAADGDGMADHALEDHQRIRELLVVADKGDLADAEVFGSLSSAMADVASHVQDEEGRMFPALKTLGQERVTELGDQMEKGMKVAPTHPHPSTPNSGIGAMVVGGLAGVVDRARDAIKGDKA